MAKFLYVYHGGAGSIPQSEQEQQQVMKAWNDWFGRLGSAVVDGGNPVGMSRTVVNGTVKNDGGANPVSGYSIIEASDVDDAVAKAKGCPMLAIPDGSVEIAPIIEMG